MKKLLFALCLIPALAMAAADVKQGKIAKVVEAKKEIYVTAEGKKHEYYFNDNTKVTKNGSPGTFADLKEGMSVKVTAEKKGKRLDPQQVEILE